MTKEKLEQANMLSEKINTCSWLIESKSENQLEILYHSASQLPELEYMIHAFCKDVREKIASIKKACEVELSEL